MSEKQCISCNHWFVSDTHEQCKLCLFKSTRTLYYCPDCKEPVYGEDVFKLINGSYVCTNINYKTQ